MRHQGDQTPDVHQPNKRDGTKEVGDVTQQYAEEMWIRITQPNVFGRVVRLPGILDLGRGVTDQYMLASKRMDNREKIRETSDKGPKPQLRQFQFGDMVRIHEEPGDNWKITGRVVD